MTLSHWQKNRGKNFPLVQQIFQPQPQTKSQTQVEAENFDLIIVGAGISGLSAAYWYRQQQPDARILIIERKKIGEGASGRNAGFLTSGSVHYFQTLVNRYGLAQALDIWQFSEKNISLVKEHILRGREKEVSYSESGCYTLVPLDFVQEEQQLRQTVELMQLQKLSVEILDQAETQKRLHSENFRAAAFLPDEGTYDPLQVLRLLAEKSIAMILEDTDYFQTMPINSKLGPSHLQQQEVHTSRGIYQASNVLLTLNAFLPLADANFMGSIRPARGQILLTCPVPLFLPGSCYITSLKVYLRQLPTGEVLIGGLRHLGGEEENTYETSITPVIQKALGKYLQENFTPLRDRDFSLPQNIASAWSGIMGFTHHELPVAGMMPDNPHLFYVGGFSGHGMGYSFLLMRHLVDGILQSTDETIPSFFRSRRV